MAEYLALSKIKLNNRCFPSFIIWLTLFYIFLFGCAPPQPKLNLPDSLKEKQKLPLSERIKDKKKKEIPQKTSVHRGKEAFDKLCIKCHGKDGKGGGVGEGILGVPVRDLTDKAYIGLLSDKEIFDRIAYGNKKVPYIVMPGWLEQISANTINDIISYVRSLETDNGPLVGLGPQERMELYKISPLERGRINYLLYCSSCHGFKGDGDGWATKNTQKAPIAFSDPNFIENFTAEKIFNYVKGLDKNYVGRTMPVFGQTIESTVIEDIASYILSLSEASMSGSGK